MLTAIDKGTLKLAANGLVDVFLHIDFGNHISPSLPDSLCTLSTPARLRPRIAFFQEPKVVQNRAPARDLLRHEQDD